MNNDEWEQWVVRLLMSGGILNALREETIREQAGRHWDLNLEYALRSLMDKGIITQLQSEGQKRYHVNHDKLDDARKIARKEVPKDKVVVAQPFQPEPRGYEYWCDPQERRTFRKQNKYRLFKKNNGEREFVGQLLGKSMRVPQNIHTGSLDDPESYISRVVNAMHEVTNENSDRTFTLQELQDKDRLACSNNRQRGKVIILICEKLGMVEFVETRGKSARYRFRSDYKPPNSVTLDDFKPDETESLETFTDPEWFEDEEQIDASITKPDKDLEGKPI